MTGSLVENTMLQRGPRQKRGIVDASSAILLYKAGLSDRLLETYRVVLPASVFDELTRDGYPGSVYFQQSRDAGGLTLQPIPAQATWGGREDPDLACLDPGERDAIRCFAAGLGDFVVTDDGRAARYCKARNLPNMNALMFPRVLSFAGRLADEECAQKMETLIGIGRYSPQIIAVARHCPPEKLLPFLP